ncbi:MAG: KpsF/GutQ family sugar-phosphate isomerase [Desulfovibrionaceae bacterium]|nr:KpsF/GutQ family sugar-phosphate isomerase [Desulfovibrionaceae bacterium]
MKDSSLPLARRVLSQQADALNLLASRLDASFDQALDCLLNTAGRVAVTGMGKSGHVAAKVAATLASTGTPAYFIHPAEASHGDLGMMSARDAVLAFSNSGETAELSDIVLFAARHGMPVLAVTRNAGSFLARHADHVLLVPDVPEACPIGCAPTTSTTLQMALGDALALALLEARGFRPEDFHEFHPGGSLGRALLVVGDIMHVGDALPLTRPGDSMSDALVIMTGKGFGCVGVLEDGRLTGMITDGDLRRHMGPGLLAQAVREVMSPHPLTLERDCLAARALGLLQRRAITNAFVVDGDGRPVGILNVHDLLRAGVR